MSRPTTCDMLALAGVGQLLAWSEQAALLVRDRMPVILEPEAWAVWLGENAGNATGLMRPARDDVLRLRPVSRSVNAVRNNGPELLDRLDDPAAPSPSNEPPGTNPT